MKLVCADDFIQAKYIMDALLRHQRRRGQRRGSGFSAVAGAVLCFTGPTTRGGVKAIFNRASLQGGGRETVVRCV